MSFYSRGRHAVSYIKLGLLVKYFCNAFIIFEMGWVYSVQYILLYIDLQCRCLRGYNPGRELPAPSSILRSWPWSRGSIGWPINNGRIFEISQHQLAHEWWGQPGVSWSISHGILGWSLAASRPSGGFPSCHRKQQKRLWWICPVNERNCGNRSTSCASCEGKNSCLNGRETGLGLQLWYKWDRVVQSEVYRWGRKILVFRIRSSPLSECF